MLIFKKIEDAYSLVSKNLFDSNEDHESQELALQQMAAIKEIISYAKSYEWLSHSKARKKIKLFLSSKYNYTVAAAELEISLNNLQSFVSYASTKLENLIGASTLDLIIKGEVSQGLLQFKIGTGAIKVESLFLNGIPEMLPTAKKEIGVDILTCEQELNFLATFTSRHINETLQSLNANKIAFVLYILQTNTSTYAYERELLYNYINGKIIDYETLSALIEVGV
jgi:hypothetical protein